MANRLDTKRSFHLRFSCSPV